MTVTGWARVRRRWPLILALGVATGLLVPLQPTLGRYPALGLVVPGAFIVIAVLLFRAPEISFALYMSAGSFKAGLMPLQASLGFDFTIALALLVIAGVAVRVISRRGHIRFHWSIASAYLLLAGWMCFSLIWSPAQEYGWEKSTRFVTLTLLAFAAPLFLLDTWPRLERFFWALFLAGVLFTAGALMSLYSEGGPRRLVTVFGADYLTLGRTCGLAAGLGTYFLIGLSKKWWLRLVLLICVGAAIFVMVLGAGRGPIVAWLLAFTPPALLRRYWNRQSSLVLRTQLAVMALFGGGWALGLLPHELTSRFELFFAAFFGGDPSAVHLAPRIHIWQVGLDTFFQTPFLGAGVGAYKTYVGTFEIIYPHNLLLEAGSELGFVGLMLTMFLIITPLARWRQCSRVRLPNRQRFLFDMVLWVYAFFFLEVMKSGDFNSNRVFWMSIGLVTAACIIVTGEIRAKAAAGRSPASQQERTAVSKPVPSG